jgi:hypothetical protein
VRVETILKLEARVEELVECEQIVIGLKGSPEYQLLKQFRKLIESGEITLED